EHLRKRAYQSALSTFTTLDPERVWTIRPLANCISISDRGPDTVGSPTTVSAEHERTREAADVDGFNLSSVIRPGGQEDFVRHVSPELRRRGLLAEQRPGATFREAVLGKGPRLAEDHRGASFRPAAVGAGA